MFEDVVLENLDVRAGKAERKHFVEGARQERGNEVCDGFIVAEIDAVVEQQLDLLRELQLFRHFRVQIQNIQENYHDFKQCNVSAIGLVRIKQALVQAFQQERIPFVSQKLLSEGFDDISGK